MKTKIIITALLLGLMATGFTVQQITKNTAAVKQIEGIYIFFASEPVREYEYLGTVKVGATWDSKTITRLNSMIKNCKSDYPTAEALIFKNTDFGSADAIKFK